MTLTEAQNGRLELFVQGLQEKIAHEHRAKPHSKSGDISIRQDLVRSVLSAKQGDRSRPRGGEWSYMEKPIKDCI